MVYYRKYRPQTIAELDSEELREKLYSVLTQKNIAHAFLFTGPKGLGKTSAARIVAKVINCETTTDKQQLTSNKSKGKVSSEKLGVSGYNIKPCNKCNQCISITNGSNLDVLEIDGASNRGIDEIRDLREKVKLAPISASQKIYIIDEVHMLTTEAFNALLKTLEEPPPHVLFILCTTEPHKVPATIFSRCLHIPFKKATEKELIRSFSRIVKSEKFTIDEKALAYIASLSEGSFRDGVKILEELVAINKNKKITKELIEEKYRLTNIQYQIEKMLDVFANRETKEGLKLIERMVEEGVDFKYFIEQLISELHQLLLIKVGVLKEESKVKLTIEEIKELVKLLSNAYTETKYAVLPQIPLEIVVIEWGEKEVSLRSLSQFDDSSNASVPASRLSSGLGIRPASQDLVKSSSHGKAPRDMDDINVKSNNLWQELIDKVKPYNHSVAGVLRGCSLKSFDGKNFVIEAKYKFHKERLEQKKTLEVLEKIIEKINGEKVKVLVELKK